MRRPIQIALGVVTVALLTASVWLYQQVRKTSADLNESRAAEQTARSNYAEAFNAVSEIQDSLNAIALGTGNVKLEANSAEHGARLTEPTRREALESIAMLGQSIQRTKEKIGELETKIKKSGAKIAGLQRMITGLKANVAEKEQQVADLSTKVDALQTQVTGLETTVADDKTQIEAKRQELATIGYVIGTKQALSHSGVIVAKGGVLGLGKTLQLSGRYDDNLFTSVDTDQQTVIETPADKLEKVKVLSAQPVSSYQLALEGNHVEIRIVDPKEFRKVKHLVVVTA